MEGAELAQRRGAESRAEAEEDNVHDDDEAFMRGRDDSRDSYELDDELAEEVRWGAPRQFPARF
jgi:hypothetical protein